MTSFLALWACSGEPTADKGAPPDDTDVTPPTTPVDADGDGVSPPEDCDDADPLVHPGAGEDCDDADDDCDGLVGAADPDVDPSALVAGFEDADADGYGDDATAVLACAPAATVGGDCDDGDDAVHPGAAEACGDGIDQDCVGGDATCHPALVSQDLATSSYPRLDGWPGGQHAGWSVDVPGDVDGDGVDDILIGAYAATGPVMVVHGGALVTESLSTAADAFLNTPTSDSTGWAVHGAGDVDADGLADVVVGLPFYDSRALVVRSPSGNVDLGTAYDARWAGRSATDNTGTDVTGGADLTGDGVLDLVVASDFTVGVDAVGAVQVVDATLTGERSIDDFETRIQGSEHAGGFGDRVDVGDVDGDGVADLVAGARSTDANGENNSGEAFLFLGPLPAGILDARTAAALVVQGTGDGWLLGYDVAVAGDLDGDGRDDWVAAAREGDIDRVALPTEGHAYVLPGDVLGTITTDAAPAAWIGNSSDGDVLRVVGADLTGDTVADLALLANDEQVHVTFGPLAGVVGPADSVTFGLADVNDGELATGDVDRDGYDDLVIGAPDVDPHGAVWVVWGAPP